MTVNERDTLRQQIDPLLMEAGWASADILRDQTFVYQGEAIRPDYILSYQLNPLAVVEVKGETQNSTAKIEQVLTYARAVGVSFGYVINGLTPTTSITEFNVKSGEVNTRAVLPKPTELIEALGLDRTENDPRLYPPYVEHSRSLALSQIIAVSRAVEAVLSGNKRVLVSTPIGTGITQIGFQIAWKLIQSGYFQRMLLLSESIMLLNQSRLLYQAIDSSAPLFSGQSASAVPLSMEPAHRVNLGSVNYLLRPLDNPRIFSLPSDFYDLIIVQQLEEVGIKRLSKFSEYFTNATFVALSSGLIKRPEDTSFFGPPVYQYSLEEAIETDELQPPQGFFAVQLGDIAETYSGLPKTKIEVTDEHTTPGIYLINARNIRPDGSISFDDALKISTTALFKTISEAAASNRYLLKADDILVTAIGTTIKLAYFQTHTSEQSTFSSSLIRIRITSNDISPQDVYNFLRSDSGQTALRRLTRGTSQSYISVRDISQLVVFLPDPQATEENSEELSAVSRALHRIRDEILPRLEAAEQNRRLEDVGNNETEEDTQQVEANNVNLVEVAVWLRQVAATLVPPSLTEKVLSDYPTPIALAYRRFLDARFNIYEKILRLKDLFEAISFFVYNLVLADALRRLDVDKYYVEDKGARKAYNGYSMATRMEFVAQILSKARVNNGEDLFIPELIDSNIADQAKHLQGELRNPISHTATATESRLMSLLKDFQPIVEGMLEQLEFLTKYRLVRIPSFYYKQGKLIRRMEVYRGPVHGLDEQELPDDIRLTQADHDHLVLLDPEDQVLDCYPFYQLLANEDTRYETHMCFFKQRKAGENLLEGESVQGAFGINLDGFDELDSLLRRLSDNS
jgi:type I restriction enzyme R subunit